MAQPASTGRGASAAFEATSGGDTVAHVPFLPGGGGDLLNLPSSGAAVRTVVVPAREDVQMLREATAVLFR